jgi:hypothetical protein
MNWAEFPDPSLISCQKVVQPWKADQDPILSWTMILQLSSPNGHPAGISHSPQSTGIKKGLLS